MANISVAAVHAQAAALMILDRNVRVGQAYYAALTSSWGKGSLSSNVLATSFDPFDDNNNLERFLAYLRYQLGEFDYEIREVQP